MDQILIGKFIAQERKRKGYTQKQLSEKLGISDKTISKEPDDSHFIWFFLTAPSRFSIGKSRQSASPKTAGSSAR